MNIPNIDLLHFIRFDGDFFFFGPGFALLFIQGLFSVLERFMPTKSRRFGLESVTTLECKQEILMS